MSNNTPETVTYQQSCREKKNSEKRLGKGRRYYEGSKERLQNGLFWLIQGKKNKIKKRIY